MREVKSLKNRVSKLVSAESERLITREFEARQKHGHISLAELYAIIHRIEQVVDCNGVSYNASLLEKGFLEEKDSEELDLSDCLAVAGTFIKACQDYEKELILEETKRPATAIRQVEAAEHISGLDYVARMFSCSLGRAQWSGFSGISPGEQLTVGGIALLCFAALVATCYMLGVRTTILLDDQAAGESAQWGRVATTVLRDTRDTATLFVARRTSRDLGLSMSALVDEGVRSAVATEALFLDSATALWRSSFNFYLSQVTEFLGLKLVDVIETVLGAWDAIPVTSLDVMVAATLRLPRFHATIALKGAALIDADSFVVVTGAASLPAGLCVGETSSAGCAAAMVQRVSLPGVDGRFFSAVDPRADYVVYARLFQAPDTGRRLVLVAYQMAVDYLAVMMNRLSSNMPRYPGCTGTLQFSPSLPPFDMFTSESPRDLSAFLAATGGRSTYVPVNGTSAGHLFLISPSTLSLPNGFTNVMWCEKKRLDIVDAYRLAFDEKYDLSKSNDGATVAAVASRPPSIPDFVTTFLGRRPNLVISAFGLTDAADAPSARSGRMVVTAAAYSVELSSGISLEIRLPGVRVPRMGSRTVALSASDRQFSLFVVAQTDQFVGPVGYYDPKLRSVYCRAPVHLVVGTGCVLQPSALARRYNTLDRRLVGSHTIVDEVGVWRSVVVPGIELEVVRLRSIQSAWSLYMALAMAGCFVMALAVFAFVLRNAFAYTEGRIAEDFETFKEQIVREKKQFTDLIKDVMPQYIQQRIIGGEKLIVDMATQLTFLFADIVNCTDKCRNASTVEIVRLLGYTFYVQDTVAAHYNIHKLKTIGDCYLCVSGLEDIERKYENDEGQARVKGADGGAAVDEGLQARQQHQIYRMASFAVVVQQILSRDFAHYPERNAAFRENAGTDLGRMNMVHMQTGIHSGPCIAGVVDVGRSPMFDCFGPSVNLASRMETTAMIDRVQISAPTFQQLQKLDVNHAFDWDAPRKTLVKGYGTMDTYTIKSTTIAVPDVLVKTLMMDRVPKRRSFGETGLLWQEEAEGEHSESVSKSMSSSHGQAGH